MNAEDRKKAHEAWLARKEKKGGYSSCEMFPNGVRRRSNGRTLAFRHFRKLGIHFMDDVPRTEIAKVYFNEKYDMSNEDQVAKIADFCK